MPKPTKPRFTEVVNIDAALEAGFKKTMDDLRRREVAIIEHELLLVMALGYSVKSLELREHQTTFDSWTREFEIVRRKVGRHKEKVLSRFRIEPQIVKAEIP